MHEVAGEFEGVGVVVENFGDSELADRFGVERYPAIFVNEVLIARPKDFGFYGETGSQGQGRYTPWLEEASHRRFQQDLRRAVTAVMQEGEGALQEYRVEAELADPLSRLPEFRLVDLSGSAIASQDLEGKVVLVEFWATWCPPCIKALPWLSRLQEQYAETLTILGVAIESPGEELRRMVGEHQLSFPVVEGDADLARAFGDVLAVPAMFVFDAEGMLQRTAFGSPPELAGEIEVLLEEWLGPPAAEGR